MLRTSETPSHKQGRTIRDVTVIIFFCDGYDGATAMIANAELCFRLSSAGPIQESDGQCVIVASSFPALVRAVRARNLSMASYI
jgi:hypothetical protein